MKHRAVCSLAFWLCVVFSGLAWPARGADVTNRFGFADFLLVPLRVHLVSAKVATNLSTTLREQDIARILPKMNRVWAQAGVHFYVESLVREEAAGQEGYAERARADEPPALLSLRPEATRSSNQFHLYYLHQCRPNGIYIGPGGIFVKDIAWLRKVEGGMDEPLPRVSSHELGHAFTLPHRQDVTNLMASGTTGMWLNDDEIKQAREAARKKEWIQPAPDVLKRAEELQKSGKNAEAKKLFSIVATVPIDVEETQRARRWVKEGGKL